MVTVTTAAGSTTLAVSDSTHGHTADAATLGVSLIAADSTHTHNADSPIITVDGSSTTTIYYFEGHTSITDTNNAWGFEPNAFDSSVSTSAFATTNGATSSNYLMGREQTPLPPVVLFHQ